MIIEIGSRYLQI